MAMPMKAMPMAMPKTTAIGKAANVVLADTRNKAPDSRTRTLRWTAARRPRTKVVPENTATAMNIGDAVTADGRR